jgi:hypothetical protein
VPEPKKDTTMRHTLLIALLATAVALPASAQDHPMLQSTRDVEVAYKTLGRNAGHDLTLSQSASIGKIRVDGGQMQGYAIVDRARHTTTVVMTEQHMYMDVAGDRPPGQQMPLPDERGTFRRTGTATIAGVTCTVWDYSNGGSSGSACITADGVMLRAVGKDGNGLEATKVVYVAQPAAKFAPPAGYQKMTMPAGMGGANPGGGMPAGGGQGFTLPPGIKLPPGVQLPPGMTLPPSR